MSSFERGIHAIKGPRNMSSFDRHQMAMDSVSLCLYWEKRHEFDSFLRWQAEFIRHLVGWLTQEEKNDSRNVMHSMWTSQVSLVASPTISGLAKLFQEGSDILTSSACSMNLAQ